VCLTDCIPVVNEFFARQDKDFVACGTMYFPPGHPIMLRCLEQTIKLGRTVKWGDTGPHMLTRVLEERGSLDRAVPASVCYPIHYSQAVELLRPSKTAAAAANRAQVVPPCGVCSRARSDASPHETIGTDFPIRMAS